MKRKEFIKYNASVLSALALGKSLMDFGDESKKLKAFGIQLYTLRDILLNDTAGIIRQLSSFGYKQIESYEGPEGMFWGMEARAFSKLVSDSGMKLTSSHCDISKDFDRKMHEALEAGMSYIICASEPGGKTIDDYKKLADEFNIKGEQCRQNGIGFAFHNHVHSMKVQDGVTGQQVLMRNTDPGFVDFQMDVYWVVTGEQDPVDWLNKYPGRFKLCHLKDRSKTPVANYDKNSVDLGTGTINFSNFLKAAEKNGMQYYYAEQESYPNGSPLEAARVDAGFLKKLKF